MMTPTQTSATPVDAELLARLSDALLRVDGFTESPRDMVRVSYDDLKAAVRALASPTAGAASDGLREGRIPAHLADAIDNAGAFDPSEVVVPLSAALVERAKVIEECAKVADDWAAVADAAFLSWAERAKKNMDGMDVAGGCAIGMAHQARRIAEAIRALATDKGPSPVQVGGDLKEQGVGDE